MKKQILGVSCLILAATNPNPQEAIADTAQTASMAPPVTIPLAVLSLGLVQKHLAGVYILRGSMQL